MNDVIVHHITYVEGERTHTHTHVRVVLLHLQFPLPPHTFLPATERDKGNICGLYKNIQTEKFKSYYFLLQ